MGMNTYKLHLGDCLEVLPTLPAASVQCVVTSPPYFGLRDYGEAGQIGLESTPAEYVAKMVQVFRGLRHGLRDDGCVWLNLGDSYNGSGGSGGDYGVGGLKEGQPKFPGRNIDNLAPKQLLGIPWRVAFALQDDGWYLRSDIIWHKPNPMPESVKDRPTRSHEYVFLLTKNARYYYDAEAIAEPLAESTLADGRNGTGRHTQGENGSKYFNGESPDTSGADKPSWYRQKTFVNPQSGRNSRTVWTIATQPRPEAHFAAFPDELARRCILAGSAPGDTVLDPFAGRGTVLAMAINNGRDAVGIELNPAYAKLIDRNVTQTQPALLASA